MFGKITKTNKFLLTIFMMQVLARATKQRLECRMCGYRAELEQTLLEITSNDPYYSIFPQANRDRFYLYLREAAKLKSMLLFPGRLEDFNHHHYKTSQIVLSALTLLTTVVRFSQLKQNELGALIHA